MPSGYYNYTTLDRTEHVYILTYTDQVNVDKID